MVLPLAKRKILEAGVECVIYGFPRGMSGAPRLGWELVVWFTVDAVCARARA